MYDEDFFSRHSEHRTSGEGAGIELEQDRRDKSARLVELALSGLVPRVDYLGRAVVYLTDPSEMTDFLARFPEVKESTAPSVVRHLEWYTPKPAEAAVAPVYDIPEGCTLKESEDGPWLADADGMFVKYLDD